MTLLLAVNTQEMKEGLEHSFPRIHSSSTRGCQKAEATSAPTARRKDKETYSVHTKGLKKQGNSNTRYNMLKPQGHRAVPGTSAGAEGGCGYWAQSFGWGKQNVLELAGVDDRTTVSMD